MGARVWGRVNENGVVEEWGQGNGEKNQKIVVKWWERSSRKTAGFGDEEDSGWGCGRVPNGCRRGIGTQGIGFGSGLDGGRNGMLGGNADEWMGEGLGSYLWSTRTLLIEERVLCRIQGGKRRWRCWRTGWCRWTGR